MRSIAAQRRRTPRTLPSRTKSIRTPSAVGPQPSTSAVRSGASASRLEKARLPAASPSVVGGSGATRGAFGGGGGGGRDQADVGGEQGIEPLGGRRPPELGEAGDEVGGQLAQAGNSASRRANASPAYSKTGAPPPLPQRAFAP